VFVVNIKDYCKIATLPGAVLRWGGGHVPPDSLVALPQIQKLSDRSDVISEVPKCFKIQIFRGSAPSPAREAYSAPPEPLADGEGLAGYGSQGLPHYRVGNPTNDRFKMKFYMKFVFFRFQRTEKKDSVMKGLMGQWDRIFGL